MTVKQTFHSLSGIPKESDFNLINYCDRVYIGYDKKGSVSFVVNSIEQRGDGINVRTNLISLETFVDLTYTINNIAKSGTFHVLKCYSTDREEIDVFLDLCEAFIVNRSLNAAEIYDVFMTLSDFFAKKKNYSYEELQGLYAELYTIYYFKDVIDLAQYWQSKDYLKFDFSITSKLKLEIKSTTKPNRIHSFSHEQLATKLYDVYVLSYKLRFDDQGLSLVELINSVLPLLDKYPKKKLLLYKVLTEVGSELLENLVFEENYTKYNMKLYQAKNIPHYEDVEGVSNAHYNSDFENVNSYNIDEFIGKCLNEVHKR